MRRKWPKILRMKGLKAKIDVDSGYIFITKDFNLFSGSEARRLCLWLAKVLRCSTKIKGVLHD